MKQRVRRRVACAGVIASSACVMAMTGCKSRPSENDFQWAAIASNTLRIMELERGAGEDRHDMTDVSTTESVPTYASVGQLNVPAGGEAVLTVTLDRPTNGAQTFLFYYSSLGVVCSPWSHSVDTGLSNSFTVEVKACASAQAGSMTWLTCRNANGQGSVTVKVVIE